MTSKITFGATIMAVVGMLSSCLSSESSSTTYDDVAITSFSLGTVKCVRTVKASDGSDSTYTYTYKGSNFPMYIDQARNEIYNADSLVVGSDLSKILVTVGTKNGGVVAFKNLDSDGYTFYSSSDSVDFSKERTAIVYSTDGNHTREYRVNVVAHEEYADSFTWNAQNINISSELAAAKNIKAVAAEGIIYMLLTDASSTKMYQSDNASEWKENQLAGVTVTPLSSSASMAVYDDCVYLLDAGTLYKAEGDSWSVVSSGNGLASVIGGCKYADENGNVNVQEFYALSQTGEIMKSVDGGKIWVADDMEDDTYYSNNKYLPSSDLNFVAVAANTNDEVGTATIIANKQYTGADDDLATAVIWNKVVDSSEQQGWFYTTAAWENKDYRLPRMENLSAASYADGIVALGGNPVNNTAKAFSQLYYSPDHGATWHKQSGMSLPATFAAADIATVVADGSGYIYILSNGDGVAGQVWKGRKNSETWSKVKKLYDE